MSKRLVACLWVFGVTFATLCFLGDELKIEIYQARDLLRAFGITQGNHVYRGPELSGGGALPGPLYYWILALPMAVTGDLWSARFSLFALTAAAAALLWDFCDRLGGKWAAVSAVSLFLTSMSFGAVLQFFNPSFGYVFVAGFLVFLFRYLKTAELRFWCLAIVTVSLGCQVHYALALLLPAAAVCALRRRGLRSRLLTPSGLAATALAYFVPQSFQLLGAGAPEQGPSAIGWLVKRLSQSPEWGFSGIWEHFLLHPFLLLGIAAAGFVSAKAPRREPEISDLAVVAVFLSPGALWQIADPGFDPRYAFPFLFVFHTLVGVWIGRAFETAPPTVPIAAAALALGGMLWQGIGWPMSGWIYVIPVAVLLFSAWLAREKAVSFWFAAAILGLIPVNALNYAGAYERHGLSVSRDGDAFVVDCAAAQGFQGRPAFRGDRFLRIATLRKLSRLIIDRTAFSPEALRERLYLVGMSLENDVRLSYARDFAQAAPRKTASDWDTLLAVHLGSACETAGKTRLTLAQIMNLPMLPAEVRAGFASGKVGAEWIGNADAVALLGLRVPDGSSLPLRFQNLGAPYESIPEYDLPDLRSASPGTRVERVGPGTYAAYWKNCAHPNCLSGLLVALSGTEIVVRAFGAPLSAPNPMVNPAGAETWTAPYLEIACEGSLAKKFVLAPSLGLHDETVPAFLAPFERRFAHPCPGRATRAAAGFEAGKVSVADTVSALAPGRLDWSLVPGERE